MQNSSNHFSCYRHELDYHGQTVHFKDNSFEIVASEAVLDEELIDEFISGILLYGLFKKEAMPYILLEVAGMQFDFFINAYNLFPFPEKTNLEAYKGNVTFTIVHPQTLQVLAERKFIFNPHFTQHLISGLLKQLQVYNTEHEIKLKIAELAEVLVTEEMIASCQLYQHIDG